MTEKPRVTDHLRLWISLVLAALPLVFIFQNLGAAPVRFLFWSVNISLALLIFIVLGICETEKETAIREAKEETGISDIEFIEGFEETINYNFQFEGELIHKEVIFFLAKTNTNKVTVSHEHLDYTWLDYENSIKKITYDNAKNVLSKVNNLIGKT